MAAVDYFIKFDGIKGESTDAKHKDEIDVESWSWGETHAAPGPSGSGGGAGKVSMQDFHFVMGLNRASVGLMKACATGQHIKTATLSAPGDPDAITVDFVQSASSVQSVARVGRPSVAHATAAGKVGLTFGEAALPDGPLEPFTGRTIVDRRALAREVERVREQGPRQI